MFFSCFFPFAELFYLSHKLVDLYPNNPVSCSKPPLPGSFPEMKASKSGNGQFEGCVCVDPHIHTYIHT